MSAAQSWAWEQSLPCSTKMVLLALAHDSDYEQKSRISYKNLAKLCGMAKRSVISHVKSLANAGYIKITKRLKSNQENDSNLFELLFRCEFKSTGGSADISPGVVQPLHQGSADISPPSAAVAPPHQHPKDTTQFIPPTVEEVYAFMFMAGINDRDQAERFVDSYESKGWMIGTTQMRSWVGAVKNWIRNIRQGKFNDSKQQNRTGGKYRFDEQRDEIDAAIRAYGADEEWTGEIIESESEEVSRPYL